MPPERLLGASSTEWGRQSVTVVVPLVPLRILSYAIVSIRIKKERICCNHVSSKYNQMKPDFARYDVFNCTFDPLLYQSVRASGVSCVLYGYTVHMEKSKNQTHVWVYSALCKDSFPLVDYIYIMVFTRVRVF